MLRDHLSYSCLPSVEILCKEDNHKGVFALDKLHQGSVVGCYSGHVLLDTENEENEEIKQNAENNESTAIEELNLMKDSSHKQLEQSDDNNKGSQSLRRQDSKYIKVLFDDDEVSVSVDATTSGNELRYINDCPHGVKPNAQFISSQLDGKWNLLLVTTTDIEKGQELLVDKDHLYWKHVSHNHSSSKKQQETTKQEDDLIVETKEPNLAE